MSSCKTCSHPKRAEIEAEIMAGAIPQTKLAERFGITRWSLDNHSRKHMREHSTINPALRELAEELRQRAALIPGDPRVRGVIRDLIQLFILSLPALEDDQP